METQDNNFSIEEILNMPIESDLVSEDKSVDIDSFPANHLRKSFVIHPCIIFPPLFTHLNHVTFLHCYNIFHNLQVQEISLQVLL